MSQQTICARHKQPISYVCAFESCINRRMCQQCKTKENLHFTQHANYIYRVKDFHDYSTSKELIPRLEKGISDSQNFINNHKSFYHEQSRLLSADFELLADVFRQVSQNYQKIYVQAFEKEMNMFDEQLMAIKALLKQYLFEKSQQQSFFSRIFGGDSPQRQQIDDIVKKHSKVFKVRAAIINLRSKIAIAKTNKTAYKALSQDQMKFQELRDYFKQFAIGFYDRLKELLSHEGTPTTLKSSIVSESKSLSSSQISNGNNLNESQLSINSSQSLAKSAVGPQTSRTSILSEKQSLSQLSQSRVRVSLPQPHPSVLKIIKLLKTISYPPLQVLSNIEGKRQQGPFKYSLGTYYGTYENGVRSGKGIFIFSKDGSFYEGSWEDDNMSGFGRLITQNSYYQGGIFNGAAQGKGTYQNSLKVYSGDWKNDQRHGNGEEIFKNKRHRYKGDFINDKYHGYGVFQEQDFTYTGQFRQGLFQGQGTVRYKNGEIFIGIFRLGERIGGRHSIPDGSYYEGQYDGGVPSGQGQFRWADGVIYTGSWRGGLQDGEGIEIIDGKQLKGIWKAGNWTRWI